MKKVFKAAAFLAAILPVLAVIPAQAQDIIPDDPQLIKGRLDNGMTYYIRHNSNPEGCADFYIIHNVGALQEEDNQNGLAHFLEHMAFNGTRHYPDKEILNFLAKDGVRFGYNVNAYTNRTETVYNISSVPLVRESFVDSVLMILHDWSCDISCEPEALDAERGVISEEWRRKDEPLMRMMTKQNDLIYKGAKHTERTVLGTLEVINGFKPHEILDFYHRWYRPDLQAIAVVGDFDAEAMEQKVREMFSDIPAAENPQPKETYTVPALQEPLFENMLDPQIKYYVLKVINKQPFPSREVRNTEAFYKDLYARQIITTVFDERISKDARKKGSPLSSGVMVTSPYSDDFYISLVTLAMKDLSNAEAALAFYVEAAERMLRYGISEDEFEAAKFKVMKKNRLNVEIFPSDIKNRQIVDAYTENFLRGYAAADPYELKGIQKMIIGGMTIDDVKDYPKKMFSDCEQIYSWCVNEKEEAGLPAPERMKEIIAETSAKDIQPAYLSFKKISMDYSPAPGSVDKVSPVKGTGSEKWELGNGATVYWTPSEPVKSDTHLSMMMFFDTGYKVYSPEDVPSARFASNYIFRYTGFGSYDAVEIRNSPECAGANISIDLGQTEASVSLSADRKSLETGFRMIYGLLTDPYFAKESALEKMKQDNLRFLGKKKENSDLFAREVKDLRYGSHPWLAEVDSSAVEAVDMEFVRDMFHRTFGDFSNMTVYISSDLDKTEIESLVKKYIASLSGEYNVEKDKTEAPLPVYEGEVVFDRSYDVETVPKGNVTYYFKGKTSLDPENLAMIEMLDYMMSARYLNQIREARGGTYHVSFGTDIPYSSGGAFESVVAFQTRPEMIDILVQDVADVMAEMASEGPSGQEMEEAAKYLVKHRGEKEAADKNSLRARNTELRNHVVYGVPYDYDYEAAIGSVSASDIRKFAAGLVKGDKFVSIYREE